MQRHQSTALVIANGDVPGRALVRGIAAKADVVICADGGARHALRLGIRPHLILGDLDSISASIRRQFSDVEILRIPEQESTDLEKAIRYCLRQQIGAVTIAGAIGDRLDHSTGALGCFRKFGRKIRISLVDRAGTLSLLGRDETIAMRRGERFSLIPVGRCPGVRTEGARYPLGGETLQLGVREGISNCATRKSVRVRHAGGTLLLYRMGYAHMRRPVR
jgi:thiamine pyrophosphokinase